MYDNFALATGENGVAHAGSASKLGDDIWEREYEWRPADVLTIDVDTPVAVAVDFDNDEMFSPMFDPHHCRALVTCYGWDLHGPDRVESSGRKPRSRK